MESNKSCQVHEAPPIWNSKLRIHIMSIILQGYLVRKVFLGPHWDSKSCQDPFSIGKSEYKYFWHELWTTLAMDSISTESLSRRPGDIDIMLSWDIQMIFLITKLCLFEDVEIGEWWHEKQIDHTNLLQITIFLDFYWEASTAWKVY